MVSGWFQVSTAAVGNNLGSDLFLGHRWDVGHPFHKLLVEIYRSSLHYRTIIPCDNCPPPETTHHASNSRIAVKSAIGRSRIWLRKDVREWESIFVMVAIVESTNPSICDEHGSAATGDQELQSMRLGRSDW